MIANLVAKVVVKAKLENEAVIVRIGPKVLARIGPQILAEPKVLARPSVIARIGPQILAEPKVLVGLRVLASHRSPGTIVLILKMGGNLLHVAP